MRIIYIYQNQINNKIYVGQTINLDKRKAGHKGNAFTKNYQHPLYNSIRKYGLNNFSILEIEVVEDQDADESEQFYIQYFRSWDREFGYNIELGGCKRKTISEETKKKILKTNAGKCYNTPEHMERLHKISGEKKLGTHLSSEWKNKISQANFGKIRTEEAKGKMSKTRIERGTFAGENNPNFGKVGELNPSSKLTWEIVNNIRLDCLLGLKGKSLMKKYNISETNMYRILKNKIWKIDKGI